MQKTMVALAIVASLLLVGVTCQEELLPPIRPSRFTSPNELKSYLKALNEYYAIVGRPRFGRSVNNQKTSAGSAERTKE
ncbi:hypothetical protein ACOMHN_006524 [Nucella lapillus]